MRLPPGAVRAAFAGLWWLCVVFPRVSPADPPDPASAPAIPASAPVAPGARHPADAGDTLELPVLRARAAAPPDARERGSPDGLRFSREDIARAASSLGDPLRFVQTLPGVGRPSDWETTLLVRGGAPDETAYLVDGIPLSRTSHFEGMQGEHGGAGMVDMAFGESIVFHRGPLPARLPDRMSGALEIRSRDGNIRSAGSRVAADVTGVGGSLEGPLLPGGQAGSYAAAYRYSALDLLIRSGAVEAFGAPRYWNGQMRISVPSGTSAYRFKALGGSEDWRNRIGDEAILNLTGHSYSLALDWENRSGGTWSRLAAHAQEQGQTAAFETLESVTFSGADSLIQRESGSERRYGAIAERSFPLGENLTFRFGGSGDVVVHGRSFEYGDQIVFLPWEDTVFYRTESSRLESGPVPEAAVYGEAGLRTGDWEWYAGYRQFYEGLSNGHGFGPRLAVRYRPARGHALKAALGLHTQPHEYSEYRRLAGPSRMPYSAQGALSWDWRSAAGMRLSLEGFAKEGFRLARPRMIPDGFSYREVFYDTGRSRSSGFEALLLRPRGRFFSFSATYSFLHHRERNTAGAWAPGPYSIPHAFNTAAEVALARGLYLGMRYSTASGNPFTASDPSDSERLGTGAYDPAREWREQAARFERVDLRLEAVRRIGDTQVTAYGEIENLLDRNNCFGRAWNPLEGRTMCVEGMGRLPIAGLALSF